MIELLAVVSILVALTGIITGILYSTLRGSNKVKITTEVSDNGAYVISVITNAINDTRNITQVGGVDINDCTGSPVGKSITLKRLNGSTTVFACSGNTIASSSASLGNSTSLINTNQVQSDYSSCSFTCMQKADDLYAVPIITMNFKIGDLGVNAQELKGSATFNTSVAVRNYLP